jgi:hypothetical protein
VHITSAQSAPKSHPGQFNFCNNWRARRTLTLPPNKTGWRWGRPCTLPARVPAGGLNVVGDSPGVVRSRRLTLALGDGDSAARCPCLGAVADEHLAERRRNFSWILKVEFGIFPSRPLPFHGLDSGAGCRPTA